MPHETRPTSLGYSCEQLAVSSPSGTGPSMDSSRGSTWGGGGEGGEGGGKGERLEGGKKV